MSQAQVPHHSNPLRLNVGYLTNLPLGESRDISFDVPKIHLVPDLDLRELVGTAHFTRTSNGILAQVEMAANLQTECVRCLTNFQLQLKINFTELYAFTRNSITDSELLFPEDGHIDLGPLVREYMILEKPIRALCKRDCKGLCPVCGENLNEHVCNHEDNFIDPRLAVLKKLLE
jgi:uncharacterized protein